MTEFEVHYHAMLIIPLDEAEGSKVWPAIQTEFIASDHTFGGIMAYERAFAYVQINRSYRLIACYRQCAIPKSCCPNPDHGSKTMAQITGHTGQCSDGCNTCTECLCHHPEA